MTTLHCLDKSSVGIEVTALEGNPVVVAVAGEELSGSIVLLNNNEVVDNGVVNTLNTILKDIAQLSTTSDGELHVLEVESQSVLTGWDLH